MRLLLTGAGGYVGTVLVRYLLRETAYTSRSSTASHGGRSRS